MKYRGFKRVRKKQNLTSKVNFLMKKQREDRPELEFDDTVGAAVDIFTTPVIVKIDAGTTGDHVRIKSVQLKGFIQQVAPGALNIHYRIVIFSDKSNEVGTLPTWAEVYKSATGADAVMSLRNISSTENEGTRFKIIYDKRFKTIDDTATPTNINDSIMFDMYKKLNIKSINAAGFWESGGLYLAYVSTLATTGADFTYQIRTRFTTTSSS